MIISNNDYHKFTFICAYAFKEVLFKIKHIKAIQDKVDYFLMIRNTSLTKLLLLFLATIILQSCVGNTDDDYSFDINNNIESLNLVVEKTPNDASAYILRGATFSKYAMYDKALSDFDQALRINPKSARAHDYRGITYMKMKKFDLAFKRI